MYMYMYVKVRGLQEEASQEFEHANAQSHRNKQTLYIIILTLDGDDELWYYRQYLRAAMLQHVMYTLPGKELIRMSCLTKTIKEQRQVVMVVQLLNLHLYMQGRIIILC